MKTRFCPSPTGMMHLGNVRTAFFNYLAAKHQGGSFLLRIEDTDKTRSYTEYTELMLEDLHWLGLSWAEGPDVGGEHGPYWQSLRQPIYDEYYKLLEEKNSAYPCFCTEQQLALTRKLQRSGGKPPRYPKTCANLSKEDIQAKRDAGLIPTLRFRVNDDEMITFVDLVRGEQRFKGEDIGDFIIRRADGSAPFMYGNALDDSLMGVTHAYRGEDHLSNTPRQILILKALNLPLLEYGHLSLIVGSDGEKLSKRHGSRSLKEMRDTGFLPGALLNYLGRLGHIYESHAYMSLEALAQHFNANTFSKAAARFDEKQLLHWQKEAILALPQNTLWDMFDDTVKKIVPEDCKALFTNMMQANILFAHEATFWANVCFESHFSYTHEQRDILKAASVEFFNAALTAIQTHGCDYAALTSAIKSATGASGKALFQPLRIALTGEAHGPELHTLLTLLGKNRALARLDNALHACI